MLRSISAGLEGVQQLSAESPAHGNGEPGSVQHNFEAVFATFIQMLDVIQIDNIGSVALHEHLRRQTLYPPFNGMMNRPPESIAGVNAGIVPTGLHIRNGTHCN